MGLWLLSNAPFDKMPYVIVDSKGDENLNEIPHVRELGLNETPKHPGVYIVHPMIGDADPIKDFLWRIWQRGSCGLLFDEGYMIPGQLEDHNPYNAILTQGRSKHIPTITLSQRPVKLSKFTFSESSHYCIFHLNARTDKKTVAEYIPDYNGDILPEFHSHWYDVKRNANFTMQPVPDSAILMEKFEERLQSNRRFI